ncbi:MAG TPA: hypothetical protein VFW19_05140 [Allosphingosinicella sp.]|nr:hypothetical protein [Allosphingosinicella sp.]
MRIPFLTLPIVALLAACHKPPPPPKPLDGPIPAQICAEVTKSLDQLEKSDGVDITGKGEAMIEQAAWFEMAPEQRDAFAQALAYQAGCASGRQSAQQEVTIRSEDGTLLMHRFVSTEINLQNAFGGSGQGDQAR